MAQNSAISVSLRDQVKHVQEEWGRLGQILRPDYDTVENITDRLEQLTTVEPTTDAFSTFNPGDPTF